MRRIGVLWIVFALAACAERTPVPAAAMPEVAPAAAKPVPAIADQRAWLRDFRVRYAAVKASARGEDVVALLRDAEAAHAIAADIPTVQFLLAAAQAANAQPDAAFATLARMADGGLGSNIAVSPAFASLQGDPRFAPLVQQFEANAAARGVVDLAFTASGLPTDFIPESITRDVARSRWLLGSVHLRRIDAVDDKGGAYDFVAQGSGGLLSALGMQLLGDTLWVASSGFNESGEVDKSQVGRAGLFEIDATSGAVRKSWWLPDDGQVHALGDVLMIGSDVYTSDSTGGGIYRLAAARSQLEPLVEAGLLLSPQGMATLDAQHIVVADYPTGLWLVDRNTGALQRLLSKQPAALTGLDGVYAHAGDLIAIQNGTSPKRILRIKLDADGREIASVTVLAQNLIGWGEPSLATIHDGALYYIANSQWDHFDANGKLPAPDQLEAPRIMRLPLD